MLSMEIHKDVMAYQPKLLAGLTGRTLLFTGLAVGVGVAVGGLEFALGLDPSEHVVPIMVASLPFWLVGYYEPHGLKFEVFCLHWLRHSLFPQRILYRSRPLPAGVANAICSQEVRPDVDSRRFASKVQPRYAALRRRRGIEGWEPDGADE